jgi:chorismate mutase
MIPGTRCTASTPGAGHNKDATDKEQNMAVKAGTTKNKATTEVAKPKRERKVLSPAERLAAKKAELEALEAKIAEKNQKQVTVLDERIAALVERGDKIKEQIATLKIERATLVDDWTEADHLAAEGKD